MTAKRKTNEPEKAPRHRATTPEGRENQLISLAVDLVEQRMINGTATSQEVTHFLKLGSSRERLEQERISHENDLLQAKREAMESAKRVEELYEKALKSMRAYAGHDPEGSDEDYD